MVAAALPVPPLPPPPIGSVRRIPVASPTCPLLRIGPRRFSPFVDCTFRHGRIPLSRFRVHLRDRSGVYAEFAVSERPGVPRAAFEFRGGAGRRSRALARAGSGGALGGNSGSFNYNCAETGEGGGLQGFLVVVLKSFESRRKRRIQYAPWLAVAIGTVVLAGILASRSAVGRVYAAGCCATMVVAIFLSILCDDDNLQLIYERFEPVSVRASDQLHTFGDWIAKIAHEPLRFLASGLQFIFPSLAAECKGDNAGIMTSWESCLISEAQNVSRNNKNSSTEDLVLYWKPDLATVVTKVSQSIAHFISIITTTEVATSHADSSLHTSGIRDLCRELQLEEVAPLAQQHELRSDGNQNIVEPPDRELTTGVFPSNLVGSKGVVEELIASKMVQRGNSDVRKEEIVPSVDYSRSAPKQRASSQQSMKCILANEACKTPTFHQSSPSLSALLERIEETLGVSPPICRNCSIPAIATDGAMVEKGLLSEDVKISIGRRPPIKSVIGTKKATSKGDGSHLVEFHKSLPATGFPVEEQSPLSNHLSRSKLTQVMETKRIRSSYPDPWQNDCTPRPIEEDVLGHGDWVVRSTHKWRNDDRSQLLDLHLIVDENSNTESPRRDGTGNGRGVNTNGSIDFWGKNAGIITKTSEQRGTLTKSKAIGRGSNFGSVDDVENDRPQERGRRFSEEEQQRLFRRGLSSSCEADQPWDGKQQPGAYGSEAVRDDHRVRRDADSAPPAGEYGRGEADVKGPQILIRDTDFEVTKSSPLDNREGWAYEGTSQPRDIADAKGDLIYPASAGGRASPSRKIVSTMMSNSSPSSSREGEGRTTQSIDETGVVNEGNYTGSKRVWGLRPNPERKVHRGPEGGSRNGRVTPDSFADNQSQSEVTVSNSALQQSKQAQTLKFEKYLDEAEALVEQGMQGLEGRIEVGVAERMLDESASLLEKASEIYPANLIAVGQWGNALLVHGQLKLKLSQQLRSILLSSKPNSPLTTGEGAIGDRERESMELTLQEVCEECEELLVDAGRKFRRALSLDKSDVRALYNWGLALCYRGQLISQEGGERAMQDADKLYLAAIDKFEALLSISQDYGAGALLNWGLAMLDRSRLRDMGDKERVQLLLQAKELFQDAVHLDPNYGQARGAVAVCSAELNELEGFKVLQRQNTMERPNRNWWQRG